MKNITHFIILFVLPQIGVQIIFSQTPNWSVEANQYQFSKTILAKSSDEALNDITDENDLISVWVNNEIRGVSESKLVGDSYYYFLTVWSNSIGTDTLSFRFYDASEDEVIGLCTQFVFEDENQIGEPEKPYYLGYCNTEFTIENIEVVGTDSTLSFVDYLNQTVTVETYGEVNLDNLIIDFESVEATEIYIDGKSQNIGETANDFSESITYTFENANGYTEEWIINVTNNVVNSTSSFEDSEISIYPTFVTERLHIKKGNNTTAKIISCDGLLVKVISIDTDFETIDLSDLNAQKYYIIIERNEKIIQSSIIIRQQ